VDIVEFGAEAINAVQVRAYDLMLMDIQMTNVDGIAVSSLAALPAGAHLLGELGAGLGVARRHHWVIGRQANPSSRRAAWAPWELVGEI
jgi:hypothetical protein